MINGADVLVAQNAIDQIIAAAIKKTGLCVYQVEPNIIISDIESHFMTAL